MQQRLRRYALVIPIGLLAGLAVVVATSHGLRTVRGGRIGGDLPAFYGAARILRSQTPASLYDWQAQRAAERDLLPPSEYGWVPYAYPPYVALAYLPLTALSFKTAYALHTIVMLVCCAIAMVLLARAAPGLGEQRLLLVAAALAFYPIFRAVLGGQNTAVSLLCATGAAAALTSGRAFTAGILLGVWLFKPQLALPVAALVTLRTPQRARLVAGVAAVAAIYYLAATAIAGPAWPLWWWREGAVPFSASERIVNHANAVSLWEVASGLGWPGAGAMAAVITAALVVWQTSRRQHLAPIELVATATAAVVLVAPHALYYDAGLTLPALALAAVRGPRWLAAAGAAWVLGWAQPLRAALPLAPLTVTALAALCLGLRGIYISGTSSYSPHTSRSASHISPTVA